jgi:hypothetical protein
MPPKKNSTAVPPAPSKMVVRTPAHSVAKKTGVIAATTTTTTTTTKVIEKSATQIETQRLRNKQVICMIDESGSMFGTEPRFKRAISGSVRVLMSLEPGSFFGLYTFGKTLEEVYAPMNISKPGTDKYETKRNEFQSSLAKLANSERWKGSDGRQTEQSRKTTLYDSIKKLLTKIKQPPQEFIKIQVELVVLTDGDDNGSKSSVQETNAHIKRYVNARSWLDRLHITVLAIGMDDDSACKAMVAGKFANNNAVGDVTSSATITNQFDIVVKNGIKQRAEITETISKTATISADGTKSISQTKTVSMKGALAAGGGAKSPDLGNVFNKMLISNGATSACKFGAKCNKMDCEYNHPNAFTKLHPIARKKKA